ERRGTRAVEGPWAGARGPPGDGRRTRGSRAHGGDAVTGARSDQCRIASRARRPLRGGDAGRDHPQPFLSDRPPVRRVSRHPRGGERRARGRSLEGRAGTLTRHATARTVSAVIERTVPGRFLPPVM